jgi:hypothetical protein
MKFLISLILQLTISQAQAQTYIQGYNLIEIPTTTATAGSTTTLAATAKKIQEFTGTQNQTVVLPNATGLQVGRSFYITNRSTGILTIEFSDATAAATILSGGQVYLSLISNGSADGSWDIASTSSAIVSTSQNYVYAGPTSGSGAPIFRALVSGVRRSQHGFRTNYGCCRSDNRADGCNKKLC